MNIISKTMNKEYYIMPVFSEVAVDLEGTVMGFSQGGAIVTPSSFDDDYEEHI